MYKSAEIYLIMSIAAAVTGQYTTDQRKYFSDACPSARYETTFEAFLTAIYSRNVVQEINIAKCKQTIEFLTKQNEMQQKQNEQLQQQQREQQNNQSQQLLYNLELILQQMQRQHVSQLTDLQNKYENISSLLNTILLQQRGAEQARNNESEMGFSARLFLDNPKVLAAVPVDKNNRGLAVLDSQLFVLPHMSTQVNVYNTNTLTSTHNITITGSSRLHEIVVSPLFNCLYISDTLQNVIYRYNLSDNVISNWSLGGECYGLSLTSTHNVLATMHWTKQIKEYTPDGSLVKEISLDSSLEAPWHAIQLSSGQLVVSHGSDRPLHRVCIIDSSGRCIRFYGGSQGTGMSQLNTPVHLVVDRYDNLLVSDYNNNRVVLLSPALTHLGYITITGHTLSSPWGLHLDQLTRRLYIEEEASPTGRVFVLTA